jgi:hypothetical protein
MAGRPSYGWKSFVGIVLMIVGFVNVIEGLVGITRTNQLEKTINVDTLPITSDVKTWGWILLIWGIIVILAGFGLLAGSTWARVVAILVASVNLIINVSFFGNHSSASLWGFTLVFLDIFIIYGVAVHCGRGDDEALY